LPMGVGGWHALVYWCWYGRESSRWIPEACGLVAVAFSSERRENRSYMEPETHYAKSGGLHIAYQVVGEGPDLVMVRG
jgi:hypothetical protein